MRKVILGLAVSLDGFIEGPNREHDWCFTDQDYGLEEFFSRIDTIFYGRKSYEVAQQYAANNNGETSPDMTEYIFSNTLKNVKEGAILISDNSIAEVRRIKSQPGKDIWLYGGASFTDALMKEKLVDELWLSIHPILLGKGKSLFRGHDSRIPLTLLDSKTYNSGLVSLWYQVG